MLIRDILVAAIVAPGLEMRRRTWGPKRLVSNARRLGLARLRRTPEQRRTLQRAVRLVDQLFCDGGNCLRRALIEIALDAGSATEPLHFGLRAHGSKGSGHAWLETWPDHDRRGSYDAVFTM